MRGTERVRRPHGGGRGVVRRAVVLVKEMGGECLNSGCVPSKALIAAARRAHGASGASGLDAFGITASPPQIDFARVHDHVQRVIAAIAPNI